MSLVNPAPPTETGYFLIADVLGFGRMVRNFRSGQTLDERIDSWVQLIERLAYETHLSRFQLISDTLFATSPTGQEGFSQIVQFARLLLQEGLQKLFPIRGAIVHGTYAWGGVIYGTAVIEAHELEKDQNWLGISCGPSTIPDIKGNWALDKVIAYPTPAKRGSVRIRPAISWRVPPSGELLRLAVTSGSKDDEYLDWGIGEKLNNTTLFGFYQTLLRRLSLDCSEFHGYIPAQALESLVADEKAPLERGWCADPGYPHGGQGARNRSGRSAICA